MNIANVASQVGTIYDRTLHTALTLPYSRFEEIAIAQNDIATASVINSALEKLYANYIQLYRYSNVASNVIPISSIAFIGALPYYPFIYNVSVATRSITAYQTSQNITVSPAYKTTITPVTSFTTITTPVTSLSTVKTTLNSTVTSLSIITSPSVLYQNLLYYSNQFSEAFYWSTPLSQTTPITVLDTKTSNIVTSYKPPFNTNSTVWKLIESTSFDLQSIAQYLTNTIYQGYSYTFYIYAKAGERSLLTMWFQDSDYAIFDLIGGNTTIVRNSNDLLHNVRAIIKPAGNGWYQCGITVPSAPIGTSKASFAYDSNNNLYALGGVPPTKSGKYGVGVGIAITSNAVPIYKGDGASGLYIWGAQLQNGNYLYAETTNTPHGNISPASTITFNAIQTTTATGSVYYAEQV